MEKLLDYGTDFTENAWEALYGAVDDSYFQTEDAALIYQALEQRLKYIPFGVFLRRYIYRRAELDRPFDEVPLSDYQEIIRDSFADNAAPSSFEPTTAKLSAMTKKWLTQQTVSRKVVFLLGFGLGMSVEDVNAFLTKALREQEINAKDPFEAICWYCFKKGLRYSRFEALRGQYLAAPPRRSQEEALYSDMTIGVRDTLYAVDNDEALIRYLSRLKTRDNAPRMSLTASSAGRLYVFRQSRRAISLSMSTPWSQRMTISLSRLTMKEVGKAVIPYEPVALPSVS